jgi:hypothetical protein
MFIIGFFKLASLGIEVGESLKGTVGCQAFSRNPKAAWAAASCFAVKSFMREPSGGPLPSCPLLRGLVSGGRPRHSLRVMETIAKADDITRSKAATRSFSPAPGKDPRGYTDNVIVATRVPRGSSSGCSWDVSMKSSPTRAPCRSLPTRHVLGTLTRSWELADRLP